MRPASEERLMNSALSERLGQLEQSVRRAAELVERLQAERDHAEAEKAELQKRLEAQVAPPSSLSS